MATIAAAKISTGGRCPDYCLVPVGFARFEATLRHAQRRVTYPKLERSEPQEIRPDRARKNGALLKRSAMIALDLVP